MDTYYISFLTLIVSSIATFLITPLVKEIGLRLNIIDKPNPRKQHNIPIVRLGGVGIYLGFLIGILFIRFSIANEIININNIEIINTVIIGSLIFFVLGLLDDFLQLAPWPRLGVQFGTAIWMFNQGVGVKGINLKIINSNFNHFNLPVVLGILISVIWIVGLTNSINWLDGLDGLASGVLSLYFISLIIISFDNTNIEYILLLAILCGCCLGFLPHNFYPAEIIMGDSGSNFLGSALASLTILQMSTSTEIQEYAGINILNPFNALIIFTILIVPIADMITVIIKRMNKGRSPFFPDRNHLHHKILRLGFNHKETVLMIYLLNGLIISIVVALRYIYY